MKPPKLLLMTACSVAITALATAQVELTNMSASYAWLHAYAKGLIVVTHDGQVREIDRNGRIMREIARSESLRQLRSVAVQRDTLWATTIEPLQPTVTVDLRTGMVAEVRDPSFDGVEWVRSLSGEVLIARSLSGDLTWRRPGEEWRNLGGSILEGLVDVCIMADTLYALDVRGNLYVVDEARGAEMRGRINGLGFMSRLFVVPGRAIVVCEFEDSTSIVIADLRTGARVADVAMPHRIIDITMRGQEEILLTDVAGRLIGVSTAEMTTYVYTIRPRLIYRMMVMRRLVSLEDEIYASGPFATFIRARRDGTCEVLSSLADPLEQCRSVCVFGISDQQAMSIMCDQSRVFFSRDTGATWRTEQMFGDTMPLSSAWRLQAIDTSLFLLYTDNNGYPHVRQVTPGGRYISGVIAPEPLRMYRRDSTRVDIIGRRIVSVFDLTKNTTTLYPFIGADTVVEEVRMYDDDTYLLCGYVQRERSLGCYRSRRSAIVMFMDRDSRSIIRTIDLPSMENALDVRADDSGGLCVAGFMLDSACVQHPVTVRVVGTDHHVVAHRAWGNYRALIRTPRGMFAGGYGGNLAMSTDDGMSWTAITGWATDSSATIEEFAVMGDKLFAVGSDGKLPVVLRIDTGSVTTSVVDVAPAEPGPAPIVIDAVVPNPASSAVTAMIYRDRSIPIEACTLELFDMVGARVLDLTASLRNASDDTPMVVHCPLNGLANGQYLLTASVGGRRSTKVVVKQARE